MVLNFLPFRDFVWKNFTFFIVKVTKHCTVHCNAMLDCTWLAGGLIFFLFVVILIFFSFFTENGFFSRLFLLIYVHGIFCWSHLSTFL